MDVSLRPAPRITAAREGGGAYQRLFDVRGFLLTLAPVLVGTTTGFFDEPAR